MSRRKEPKSTVSGKSVAAAVTVALVMASGTHHHHWNGGAHLLGMGANLAGHASANVALANHMAAKFYGWRGAQRSCLDTLWMGESGFRVNADTRASGLDPAGAAVYAYGIPQARPAQKMAAAGPDWRTSARTQVRWGLSYIKTNYVTPCNALAFKRVHGNQGY